MTFPESLLFGTLIKRYKRFLADVELDDGRVITVHCPNTGRMTTCAEAGWRVALLDSHNPKRKYRFTWELVHNGAGWICVNTGRANQLAFEAISAGLIPAFSGYDEVLREQTFGNSRFDLLLQRGEERCYVEVKSVTLLMPEGCYGFPDAITDRGQKHLKELVKAVKAGYRAAMLFVILRSDGSHFRVAHEIDPTYAELLRLASASGVEMYAWRAVVSPEEMRIYEAVKLQNLI